MNERPGGRRMIVVDASALVLALADEGERGAAARAELDRDGEWTAPEHILIEVMQSLRGLYLARELTAARVAEIAAGLPDVPVERVDITPLLGRIWELKDNLTPDDAAYVALAERLDAPLVTADLRLMRASGPRCEIRGIPGARPGGAAARSGNSAGNSSGDSSGNTPAGPANP